LASVLHRKRKSDEPKPQLVPLRRDGGCSGDTSGDEDMKEAEEEALYLRLASERR
jgi:hypothetical protein